MPIFGADHTEPDGSTFARSQEDFTALRKAVKEIDAELKRNFKYFKGMNKTLEDASVAINHFYDGSYTTTEYRTRGSRLNNMVSRIAVGVETYDKEYGVLLQMVSSYDDKLKGAKALIDERLDKLADYNEKKKRYTAAQSKEGKDPAKVKASQDKFQTAKDAFDAADAKVSRELTTIFGDACVEFEECYLKFLKSQANLFGTAAAALGGADLPMQTTQFSVTGSDDAPSKTFQKEKKEKKKKGDKRASSRKTDVFEPNPERSNDDITDDDEDNGLPPPSLHTPPVAHSASQVRGLVVQPGASVVPPLPPGRPEPPSTDAYAPPVPVRSHVPSATYDSNDIVTDLDLIGREAPNSARSNSSQPAEAPPALPPGRSEARKSTYGLDSNSMGAPPTRAATTALARPTPAAESQPPPLPAGRHSMAPGTLEPIRDDPKPALPPERSQSAALSRPGGGPPALPPSAAPPTLPPGRDTGAGAPPALPPGRMSAAPGMLQPTVVNGFGGLNHDEQPSAHHSGRGTLRGHGSEDAPPVLPPPNRHTFAPGSLQPLREDGPPALPPGRATVAPGVLQPITPESDGYSSDMAGRSRAPSLPAASSSNGASPRTPQIAIPAEEVHKYGLIFKREDPNLTGYITGQQAFGMFTRSKLPSMELAQIWELSDQDKDGKLTRDEFIIAMWYINSRLKQTIETIPKEVHPTLVLAKYPDRRLPTQ